MKFLRITTVPLFVLLFVFTAAGVYSPVVTAQKERSAHSKKQAKFHYVCPMHEDVTSKSRGSCHKCKMKLVRKPAPPRSDQ
jgi:Heavy metal binding domain